MASPHPHMTAEEEEELARLEEAVAEAQRRNEHLVEENELFADFLLRKKKEDGADASKEDAEAAARAEEEAAAAAEAAKSGAKKRRGKGKVEEEETTLTLETKFAMATGEIEALNKDLEEGKRVAEQNLEVVKALMEETDIRIAELKRDAYEFRRDCVVGGENPRTGTTQAEKLLKFLEDKITAKNVLIDKLMIKNQALKNSIRKLEKDRLKSKIGGGDKSGSGGDSGGGGGDGVQYIDFHQLQIENAQFVVKIEEANAELFQLKKSHGATSSELNRLKKALTELASEASFFGDEIKERKAGCLKLDGDLKGMGVEMRRMDRFLKESDSAGGGGGGAGKSGSKDSSMHGGDGGDDHNQSGHTGDEGGHGGGGDGDAPAVMPQILDYVNQKREAAELAQQHKQLSKKLEITTVAWKRAKMAQRG